MQGILAIWNSIKINVIIIQLLNVSEITRSEAIIVASVSSILGLFYEPFLSRALLILQGYFFFERFTVAQL